MKAFTKEDVIAEIKKEIAKSSQRKVAKAKGISNPYLSDVINGHRGISENLAEAFGFARQVYTEVRFYRVHQRGTGSSAG